jgi:hypothetical protein
VSVSVESGPSALDAVAPWLAVQPMRSPQWEIPAGGEAPIEANLTPLADDQALVGIVGGAANASIEAVAPLFPGKSIVPVRLTGTPPMPGDPAAWEALDAVVFDAADDALVASLLAQGTSVVAHSDTRPGGTWTWAGGPGRWYVLLEPAGPRGAIHPGAYAPVTAWQPGWPAPLRRRAALLAIVFCLVAVGVTLWRGRTRAALGIVIVSVIATAAFAWWGARQPLVCEATTGVTVAGASGTQLDRWHYLRPLRRREVSVDWTLSSKPIFASPRHQRESDVRLEVGSDGRPVGFVWTAAPGTTMAFLTRAFDSTPGRPGPAARALPMSPARELVLDNYLQPGDVLLDDGPEPGPSADDWSVVWPPIALYRPSGRPTPGPVTSVPAAGRAPEAPP